jgi:hypothetical protein
MMLKAHEQTVVIREPQARPECRLWRRNAAGPDQSKSFYIERVQVRY